MQRALWSVAVAASALSWAARAEEPKGESRKVAEVYLDALTGKGDEEVYWHPKDPVRAPLAQAGGTGRYSLELHLFTIETREDPRQVPRQWPLRVLRFRAGRLDTGWKILPASDWNAE